jgi:acyl-CoA synthetase (AMP-forming)/AMP-acid ligase II
MSAKGMPWEMETRLVKDKVQRVYKNLPPSLRAFWLQVAPAAKDNIYVVYGQERMSYATALQNSLKAAAVFERVYGIQKGDRVAICARNIPDYLVAWWACHLLGAVAVLVNA